MVDAQRRAAAAEARIRLQRLMASIKRAIKASEQAVERAEREMDALRAPAPARQKHATVVARMRDDKQELQDALADKRPRQNGGNARHEVLLQRARIARGQAGVSGFP